MDSTATLHPHRAATHSPTSSLFVGKLSNPPPVAATGSSTACLPSHISMRFVRTSWPVIQQGRPARCLSATATHSSLASPPTAQPSWPTIQPGRPACCLIAAAATHSWRNTSQRKEFRRMSSSNTLFEICDQRGHCSNNCLIFLLALQRHNNNLSNAGVNREGWNCNHITPFWVP